MNHSRLRAYILLLIATVIWGIAGPVIKFTLRGIEPLPFLTYRFGISALVAIISFAIFGVKLPKKISTLFWLFIFGFFNTTVSLCLLFFGLKNTTVLETQLITMINPLLVSFAGVIFLREHVTKKEKLGMGIALFGTLFIILGPLVTNGDGATRFSGNILILLSLVTAVLPAILAKKLLRQNISPLIMTNVSFIVGFITLLPITFIYLPWGELMSSVTNLALPYQLGVFYMALLSGTLAYWLSTASQKTIEIGEAAVFSYLYPIFATPLAVYWLGEKITPSFIWGAAIVATGVVVAEVKKRRSI